MPERIPIAKRPRRNAVRECDLETQSREKMKGKNAHPATSTKRLTRRVEKRDWSGEKDEGGGRKRSEEETGEKDRKPKKTKRVRM